MSGLAVMGGTQQAAHAVDGALSGTVTEAISGAHLSGVSVQAFCWQVEGAAAGEVCGETETTIDGTYSLSLAPGIYKVLFDNWPDHAAQYHGGGTELGHDDSLEVSVPDGGAAAGIDAALVPLRAVVGTATGNGEPLGGINVTAYQQIGTLFPVWESTGGTVTGPAGTYALHLPDGTYRIGFSDADGPYQSVFFDGANDVEQADDVVVAGDDVAGIDADMAFNYAITGTVTVDGVNMPGVAVTAWQQVPDGSGAASWESVKWTTTGSDGTYALYLPDGTYRVEFKAWQARFPTVYYDGATNLEAAADVVVAGAEVPNIDAAIVNDDVESGPAITGTLTVGNTGGPAEGVLITAWRWNTGSAEWEHAKETSTGPDGTYRLYVPEGTYRIGFSGPVGRYQPLYYDGVDNIDDADDVVVTGQDVPNVDAQLIENHSISGTITADPVEGAPPGIPPTLVTAWRWNEASLQWDQVSQTGAAPDGQYLLYVPDGSYRIGFTTDFGIYTPVYYDGAGNIDDADDVVVAGDDVTGIGAHLVIAGTEPEPDPGDPWPSAATLSDAGQDAWHPRVAVGLNGAATAVWTRWDGSHNRAQATTRAANGRWSEPTTLSEPDEDASDMQAAVGSRGRAVVVWRRWNGSNYQVQATTRTANGRWSAPTTLSEAGEDAWDPRVAVSSDGAATVVWRRWDGSNYQMQATTRAVNGRWSAPTTLSEPGEDAWDPHVAVGPNGDTAIAVWSRSDGALYRVQASTGAANGSWSSPATLSHAGGNAWEPRVAVASDGAATVVWRQWDAGSDRIRAASRAPGEAWTAPATLSAAGHDAHDPQVAVDPDEAVTAVWARWDGSNDRVEAASRVPGEAWSTPVILSRARQDAQIPQVAAGSDGTATAVWRQNDDFGEWVEVATRRADGSWPTPTELAGDALRAYDPQVATGPDGTVAAVWERHDGSHYRVQGVVLVPVPGNRCVTATSPSGCEEQGGSDG